jgi:hypothetical protein
MLPVTLKSAQQRIFSAKVAFSPDEMGTLKAAVHNIVTEQLPAAILTDLDIATNLLLDVVLKAAVHNIVTNLLLDVIQTMDLDMAIVPPREVLKQAPNFAIDSLPKRIQTMDLDMAIVPPREVLKQAPNFATSSLLEKIQSRGLVEESLRMDLDTAIALPVEILKQAPNFATEQLPDAIQKMDLDTVIVPREEILKVDIKDLGIAIVPLAETLMAMAGPITTKRKEFWSQSTISRLTTNLPSKTRLAVKKKMI